MELAGVMHRIDSAAELEERIADAVVVECRLFGPLAPLWLQRFAVEVRKRKDFRRLFDDAAARTDVMQERRSFDELHCEKPVGLLGEQFIERDEIGMGEA